MTESKLWTVNAIKDANRAAGFHWFDPDTMRFFGTRVLDTVYQGPGGIYFVTSEKPPHGLRVYTVRQFDPVTSSVETVGEVASIKTQSKAIKTARRLADGPGEATETTETFRPVTVLEQFLADLRKHCPNIVSEDDARLLASLARQHHRYMERLCSDEVFCRALTADGEHALVKRCESRIRTVAERIGAGVIFSGDPRGVTVKLVFADGFTNDFGGTGYCAPTEL